MGKGEAAEWKCWQWSGARWLGRMLSTPGMGT